MHSILRRPTDQIIRARLLPVDGRAGILWSVEPEEQACAMAPVLEAKRLARHIRGKKFTYRDQRLAVGSTEHEAVLAAAISAKVAQQPAVQAALRETESAKLVFPLTFSRRPGALARVTPLALMIERWKLVHWA